MNVIFDQGIYLPELDLWLDSHVRREMAVISNVHAGRASGHETSLFSTPTHVLLWSQLQHSNPWPLEYGEPFNTSHYTLSLYPSGHCLGSSQVFIKSHHSGQSVLYTGDFKVRTNPTAEPLKLINADVLVMEATYGRPGYRFPPQEQALEQLFDQLKVWLSSGFVPIVLADHVGKAQEMLHYLLKASFFVSLHPMIHAATKQYEDLGIIFPGLFRMFDGCVKEGEVLLFPSRVSIKDLVSNISSKRTALVTGWAVEASARRCLKADVLVPFSDHPDFDELVRYVKAVAPSRIYTVHGFPDLSAHLRFLGYNATHIYPNQGATQLTLF